MKPSEALRVHSDEVRRIVESCHARNPRVSESVLHGEDSEGSDLDMLVDPAAEISIFAIGEIRFQSRALLGVPVDVLTPNALHAQLRERVVAEARAV